MAIFSSTDQFCQYRYMVNKATILFPDGPFELPPERIMNISLEEDYLTMVYPVFSMHVILEQSTHIKLLQNKDNLKIQLDIRKYWIKDEARKLQSVHEFFINQQFSLILDDTVNYTNKDIHKKEYPAGDKNEMNAMTTQIELYLFSPDTIQANRKTINRIISKSNVADAIGRILIETGLKKNVLMSRVDNDEIYETIVIPQMKIAEAIDFINAYYGVYKTGMIFFFGLVYSYLLPYCKRSKCLLPDEQEIVTIVMPKMGSEMGDKLCTVKKMGDKSPYVIADSAGFTPRNEDTTVKVLYDEDVDVVDNTKAEVDKTNTKNKGTIIKTFESPYYKETYKARIDALKSTITVTVKDCDLSVFTPNKVYQFVFEDTSMTKRYDGFYHLVQLNQNFSKEETTLRGGAVCTFHKNLDQKKG